MNRPPAESSGRCPDAPSLLSRPARLNPRLAPRLSDSPRLSETPLLNPRLRVTARPAEPPRLELAVGIRGGSAVARSWLLRRGRNPDLDPDSDADSDADGASVTFAPTDEGRPLDGPRRCAMRVLAALAVDARTPLPAAAAAAAVVDVPSFPPSPSPSFPSFSSRSSFSSSSSASLPPPPSLPSASPLTSPSSPSPPSTPPPSSSSSAPLPGVLGVATRRPPPNNPPIAPKAPPPPSAPSPSSSAVPRKTPGTYRTTRHTCPLDSLRRFLPLPPRDNILCCAAPQRLPP